MGGDRVGHGGTRYDVVRMLWALRTDQGLTANQISDLLTNTCFRTWAEQDAAPYDDSLPWSRLEASAAYLPQAIEDALDAEADHVYH